ncbi:MAG: hypothetical protein NT080_05040 [Spirochaetes bacterium]|nr:hypothetical protein [Spirochaetota bacterium]
MKKLLLALIVFLVVACPLIAQSDQMTPEQQKLFKEQSLSVQIPSSRLFFTNSDRLWIATQGYRTLSESSFYEIAGFPEEAKQAAAQRANGFALGIIGGIGMLGGEIWWLSALVSANSEYTVFYDPSRPSQPVNATAAVGGLVVMLLSQIPYWTGMGKMLTTWSTVDQAKAAADEFNSRLLQKIEAGEGGGEVRQ